MGSRARSTGVETRDGRLVQHVSESDAPNLPVDQLRRLEEFRPDLVDWFITEYRTESEHRRTLERGVIELEKEALGQQGVEVRRSSYFGLFIGISGVVAGAAVVILGGSTTASAWAGVGITTAATGTLGVAYVVEVLRARQQKGDQ